MKKAPLIITAALSAAGAAQPAAAKLTMTVTNLTQGIYFTPLAMVAHNTENSLFEVGQAASNELQAMAEGSDNSSLLNLRGILGSVGGTS